MIAKLDKNIAPVFNLLELVTKSWLWPRISFFLKILPKVFRDKQGVTSPQPVQKRTMHICLYTYTDNHKQDTYTHRKCTHTHIHTRTCTRMRERQGREQTR